MYLKNHFSFFILFLFVPFSYGQRSGKNNDAPDTGNPILPGYFADPTVKKFGDTYYIYATTDGNGGGFGPAQVWTSKDFVNWSLQDMNWPTTHYYWAPDVTKATDGKYYMYYCQPVEIFGAWANSPVGPWTPLLPLGEPVVKNFLVPNVITLDGQTFRDDDGKMYMFWGTWGIYPNHGCGVGQLNADMKSFAKLAQIPNTVAKDFFEAPFMFKRNGLYYLTYSSGRCEDDTYRVQYAVSKTGPMGPFVYGKNNPILSTSGDGTVHGPGHQSVLQQGNAYYLIYHRHNNPHSGGGYHRQVAADKLIFDAEGNIEKLDPTHQGVGFLAKNVNPSKDILFGKSVTASSFYSEDFKPAYVADHNNGTLWKPQDNTSTAWLEIDMGRLQKIESVHTQFEYATWYYQYLIEYSADGKQWKVFADRTANTIHGSPMIDVGQASARYLRITITNTEYPGLNKGIWNIRAFADNRYHPEMAVKAKPNQPAIHPQGLLVDLDARRFDKGTAIDTWPNQGQLGGTFLPEAGSLPAAAIIDGKNAVVFNGKTSFRSSFAAPASLSGNSSFTIAMWVHNPVIEDEEPVLSWTARGGLDMSNAAIGYGSSKKWGAAAHWGWADMPYTKLPDAGKWHHIALVFDGTNEKLYVDGILDRVELKMLFLANLKNFVIGSNDDKNAFFSGALASIKVYDIALADYEIVKMAAEQNNTEAAVYLDAAGLNYGPLQSWKNNGYSKGSLLPGNAHNEIPEVADSDGKIAVVFNNNAKMNFDMPLPDTVKNNCSVVMEVLSAAFGPGWHQVVDVYENQIRRLYIDGILQKRNTAPLITMENHQWSIGSYPKSLAIASIITYHHNLDEPAIKKLYHSWQKTISARPVKAQFNQLPLALSTDMVSMSAKAMQLPGHIHQYSFTELTGKPGGASSGWIDQPEYINFALSAGQHYAYTIKVRDNYGNVTEASQPTKVNTNQDQFNLLTATFNHRSDIITDSAPLHAFATNSANVQPLQEIPDFWDGVIGSADSITNCFGALKISSTATKWDGGTPLGPFLYKNITGDFVAQVEITDVSGLKNKKANGANDVGLMVRADSSFRLLQNSIFPGWGVGNMVTSLDGNGRAQNNNASAWDFYPHLQIQRNGHKFYFRGSRDGSNWKDLPGSPLTRPDLDGTLQVGLFQATYGAQSGYGIFDNFKIIEFKH